MENVTPLRYNSRASSANGSSVKSVSQLTVQLTELGVTGPKSDSVSERGHNCRALFIIDHEVDMSDDKREFGAPQAANLVPHKKTPPTYPVKFPCFSI